MATFMGKRKRSPYLLLEIAIALLLLSIFLNPALFSPFSLVKKQKEQLALFEVHFQIENALLEAEEKLRTAEIPWSVIEQAKKKPQPLPLTSSKTYSATLQKATIFTPKTLPDRSLAMLTIRISYLLPSKKNIERSRLFFVERKKHPFPTPPPDVT